MLVPNNQGEASACHPGKKENGTLVSENQGKRRNRSPAVIRMNFKAWFKKFLLLKFNWTRLWSNWYLRELNKTTV